MADTETRLDKAGLRTLWELIVKYINKRTNGKHGIYIGSGEIPDGYNVQIDPEGSPSELVTKDEFDSLSGNVDTLNDDIDELENRTTALESKYTVQYKSFTASSSTYYAAFQTDITISGYRAIGVVGWNLTSLGGCYSLTNAFVSGNKLYSYIVEVNAKTWAQSATVGFYILYEKI